MELIYFILGFIAFPIVSFFLLKFLVWYTGKPITLFGLLPNAKPQTIKSYLELQDVIKQFINKGNNNTKLYILSDNSRFKLILNLKHYKKKLPAIIVLIRNSDNNVHKYGKVRKAIVESQINFIENFTPKTKQPKDIHVKYYIDSITPVSGVVHLINLIYQAADEGDWKLLKIGINDPIHW